MDKQAAKRMIKETFEKPFDKGRFAYLARNLLKSFDDSGNFTHKGNLIPDSFKLHVQTLERVGKYQDDDGNQIDILIVRLRDAHSLEHARSRQRNFIARYLTESRGKDKDAALVAFESPESGDWRFSLVRMDYSLRTGETGKTKVKTELTPARRLSFLVGTGESSHTAQRQLLPILEDDGSRPSLADLEKAFSIEVVTREFFEKYRDLFCDVRKALSEEMARNPRVRQDFEAKGVDADNFAKKLLGQIVFLYFLQKKGWFGVGRDSEWGSGPRSFLRQLFEKGIIGYRNFFNDILEPLFYNALAVERPDDYSDRFNCKIPFLNGGLFDPICLYDWVHTDLLLPDDLFSNQVQTKDGDTGTGILDIFDRYNFTVKEDEPLEKEVAVDPEMLGKVFENLLEERDRKSKGTYYTPREIVHYMCQEALINYLDRTVNTGEVPLGKMPAPQAKLFGEPDPQQMALTTTGHRDLVPRMDIEQFVRQGELAIENDARVESHGKETKDYYYRAPESIRWNADAIDQKLASIRVCDPAIGSGAFPVGMMQEIVKARQVLSTYLTDKAHRSAYEFKRQCIRDSLYGVDIDPGAVEIAKLRLWLSLVVDEEDRERIKPLPNLDYKIVCGDSLLGLREQLEMDGWPQREEVVRLEALQFDETGGKKKEEYKQRIDRLLQQLSDNGKFNFRAYFPQVFGKQGGFDVVVANPPYVRQEKIKELKEELQKCYDCYTGVADLYVYFYECGFKLLREGGALTFISSNKYFRSGYGEKLRRFLATKATLHQIIDFGDAPVFEAIAYPSIVVLSKGASGGNQTRVLTWQPGPSLEQFASVFDRQSFLLAQRELTADGWRLESPAVLRLLEKLRRAGKPLGEYVNGRFYRGIVTGSNEAFVVDRATRDRLLAEHPSSAEILKPFLRGRDVKRWRVEPQDLWLIFTRHGIDIKKYPAIHEHLSKYREQLTPGVEGGRKPGSYKWYEIQDNIAYWQEFERPKIVIPAIAQDVQYAPDFTGHYSNDKTSICVTNEVSYLLGLLNSKLLWWLIRKMAATRQGGFYEFKPMYVSQIAVPAVADHKPVEELVDQVLAAKSANPDVDVSALEGEIDQLVYRLYGLTAEEIRIVEESASK